MKKKRFMGWLMTGVMCLSLLITYPCEQVKAMTVLETDVATASEGCTMLGVYGSYYSQAQDALDRINEIRREACEDGNVPDPRNSSRMLTASDYVPIKWSTDLESIARIRAMEGGLAFSFMSSGHDRLNGKGTFSINYNGVSSWAEDLAYNWGTSMVSGINQWYGEKSDWVNQVAGTVTGHYTSMINPKFTYVGLGDFYTEAAQYPNTLAGEFSTSSQNLDQTMQVAQTDVMQKIEVKTSYITGYILDGVDTIYTDGTTMLVPRVNLQNGSETHKLWVLDSVTYTSSDPSIATVTDEGIVTGLKNGTTTIIAKTEKGTLAEKVITVKCNHTKELISETFPTCTTIGLKVYSCEICGEAMEQVVPKIPHTYIYGDADSQGYRTGICSVCGEEIKIVPPTTMSVWWRNSTSDSNYYWSFFPDSNPIGSTIYCWINDVDGDSAYRDMVIESTDESVVSVPETAVANSSNNQLKVLAPGITTLTIYPKYNPNLKSTIVARIGENGSVDITTADVTLSQTSYEYSGTACKPSVSVSYHDTVLKQGTDYTVTYENNTAVGTATIVITGSGIFAGTIHKNYTIQCTEHTVVTNEEVPATCKETGLTAGSHCSVCNSIIVEQSIIEALGHDWDTEYTIDVPATATSDGSMSIHCSRCSETKDQTVIPALGEKDSEEESTTEDKEETTTAESEGGNEKNTSEDKEETKTEESEGGNEESTTEDKQETTTEDLGSGKEESTTENKEETTTVNKNESTTEEKNDVKEETNYLDVGDTFTVNALTYKVVVSNPEKNTFEVSCIKTSSKSIRKLNISSYVSYNDVDYKVVSVGDKAFAGCKKLKNVTLASTITSIGKQAFSGCTSLKKITIPSKVKKIGTKAFAQCKNLRNINIKTKLLTNKTVGKQAFTGIHKKVVVKAPSKKKTAYQKMLKTKGLTGKNQKMK